MIPGNPFQYREGVLHCEQVDLSEIAARAGTPCYVYSRAAILERFLAYHEALASVRHMICYAVKANSNLA
ncbi:MAG: diaminopimelate decarboxylase, partial [Bryobacteraceae bacterium]